MSRNCSVTIAWADAEYVFQLKLGQLEELQEKCDAGPFVIYERLVTHTCRLNDWRETIRLGLIGGGMKPPDALKLVRRYVDERPWAESILPATVILGAAIRGIPDEEPGKAEAAEPKGESPNSPEESSVSPPSTEPVL